MRGKPCPEKYRFFAEFTLSGNCRFFAALRMTSEGLRITILLDDARG